MSKSFSPPHDVDSKILRGYCGARKSEQPRPISNKAQKPTPRMYKGSEDESKKPSAQETGPRTTLSSGIRDHTVNRQHTIKGGLPEYPKRKEQVPRVSNGRIAEEQVLDELSPPH